MTDGEPYRPSNGTEGDVFMTAWCARCVHDALHRQGIGDGCAIAAASMALPIDDAGYPKEWRRDEVRGPHCTGFQATDDDNQPLDPAAVVRPLL